MGYPEKQGPACEKCSFVDFWGGDWCTRSWSDLAVAGEPKVLYNHLLCCSPNLHAAFCPENPADKLTGSAAARLLVSFFRVSVTLEVVSRGTHDILSTLEEDLTPEHAL
jgi:hypothetical protein